MKKKIVIIGAGLAGSLLCNALVKEFEVVLLEKGSKNSIRFPQIRFTNKKLAEVHTFCFGGGGTTNLWHNGLIPIDARDVGGVGFLKMLAEAKPYMDRAAAALFFKGSQFSGEYALLLDRINALPQVKSAFRFGVDCLLYPKKFHKLGVDPRVRAYYGTDGITFAAGSGHLKSVRFTAGGRPFVEDADHFIICAGAMGTPAVLRRVIEACGGSSPKIGSGFIDHPMGFVGKVKFKKNFSSTARTLSLHDRGSYQSRSAVRLKSRCGRYSACAFFRPAVTMDNDLSIYKYKSSLGASSGGARVKNIFSFKLFHPDILAEIAGHLFGIVPPGRTYNILLIAEQKPGENRVSSTADPITVDWRISEQEIASYREMLEDLKGMLDGVAEEINIHTGIDEQWLWSAAHHSGTTPVGAGPDDLADHDLKLKCCDNAFVCDGSVIQEHSYANTGLTIAQLALRLADRLLRQTDSSKHYLQAGATQPPALHSL